MASKSNEVKRARATNFSFNEKELLLKYAIENQNILENKESNVVSRKKKRINAGLTFLNSIIQLHQDV